MNAHDSAQAAAELATTRLCLGWSLAAIAQPSACLSLDMLDDALDRSANHSTVTLRALAFIAADALSDRLFGELAHSAACALVVLPTIDC